METLQNTMLQKHETDFVAAYKDHMLKVQFELIQFQKKSSEYYQMIKKNEKIKTLETSISWLREESINLSHKNEKLQKVNKDLDQRLKLSQAECEDWAKTAAKNKSYNVVLQKTVSDLKNPALIHKYEEQGRLKAE